MTHSKCCCDMLTFYTNNTVVSRKPLFIGHPLSLPLRYCIYIHSRRFWRYQKGNQNPYIEEQTTQWPKKKYKRTSNDLQNTHKTKDWVTPTPLKIVGKLKCSGRVGSSCFTSGTRRVNLVTNPVISHEWGKAQEVLTTSGTYPWSFLTKIFHNGQPRYGGDRKTFEVMTST